MEGPKPKKSKAAMVTPRYNDPNKRLPYELSKPGQGPGETPTPAGARNMVKNLFKQKKMAKYR